jgi:hypothetical protein
MGSYKVVIRRAWCSQKAYEICSLLIQKKKLKKNCFSLHKLSKLQSTNFWSQGILGIEYGIHMLWTKYEFVRNLKEYCVVIKKPILANKYLHKHPWKVESHIK